MSGDRDIVLELIRGALAGDDDTAPVAIPREYRRSGSAPPGSDAVVELMVDRLLDYKALVRRADVDTMLDELAAALAPSRTVVIPAGLPTEVVETCSDAGRVVFVDGEPRVLSAAELDAVDAVVTEATVSVADSGTILLDCRAGQGRRAITLVPDHHVVILRAEQIVETMPEALPRVDPLRPITMIAGPSATSDIELNRVEGVHGPRTLEVIVVHQPSSHDVSESHA